MDKHAIRNSSSNDKVAALFWVVFRPIPEKSLALFRAGRGVRAAKQR